MSSDQPNPIADVAEGVTKGVIKVSAEGLKHLLERFQNKDVAFVSDPDTIILARDQRKTSEWHLFTQIVDKDDHFHRILFQVGLALRKLEGKKERLESLRNDIRNKYDTKGLHIAQLIQNGFFNRLLANALERNPTPQQLKFEIKNIFDNIENSVVFVNRGDNVQSRIKEITTKIFANSPKTFIVCGSGFARKEVDEIVYILKKWVHKSALKYEYELYQTRFKEVFFLNKSEE